MARLRSLNAQLEAENSRLQAEIIDLKQQLTFCLSMISSENRFPLFGIML